MNFLRRQRNRKETDPPCLVRIGDSRCTGCAACANGCERAAIDMKLTREGFYRPTLKEEKTCNKCFSCFRNCPVISFEGRTGAPWKPADQLELYAAWSNDKQIQLASSSGGIFSELARLVLERSGAVCGCEWGTNWTPRHSIVTTWEGIPKLRGSKYIPSSVGTRLYNEVIALARKGTDVLFCGTPCQISALNLLCPSEARERLLLVDLVCHGVPSLTSFRRYVEWRFGTVGKLTSFSFRDKELSIQRQKAFFYSLRAATSTGEEYMAPAGQDPWFKTGMMYNLFLQRSCFACRFSGLNRVSDITLGDFWGIPDEWHSPAGDSVVLANSEKGKNVINELVHVNRIRIKPVHISTALEKSSRLRGDNYNLPAFRTSVLKIIAHGRSFGWIYVLYYLPRRLSERAAAYRRKLALLSATFFQRFLGCV